MSLQKPQPETFDIGHIAHSLAQINRFTGHASRPYSVAEHSLLVCDIAERYFGLDVHGQLAALLHDAHEAYTTDLSTPAKAEVGGGWRTFEAASATWLRCAFAATQPSRPITARSPRLTAWRWPPSALSCCRPGSPTDSRARPGPALLAWNR